MILHKGEVLFRQGEEGPLFRIRSGLFKVVRLQENGEQFLFNILNPGELIPHHSLLTPKEYHGTAIALITSEVEVIPAAQWYAGLEENPPSLPGCRSCAAGQAEGDAAAHRPAYRAHSRPQNRAARAVVRPLCRGHSAGRCADPGRDRAARRPAARNGQPASTEAAISVKKTGPPSWQTRFFIAGKGTARKIHSGPIPAGHPASANTRSCRA